METVTVQIAEWTGKEDINRVPIKTKLPEGQDKLGPRQAKEIIERAYKEHKHLMDKTTKHRLQVISYQFKDFTIFLS
jgi:hypothetical protein